MTQEYFPFKVGDKLKSPNAFNKTGERRGAKNLLGEIFLTDEYMEITAIGNTMFLATHDHNEHLYSKLNQYELWTPEPNQNFVCPNCKSNHNTDYGSDLRECQNCGKHFK